MKEKWMMLFDYEGQYYVSNKGRIKSIERSFVRNGVRVFLNGKILKQHISKRGYWCVKLSKDGITKTKTVHRYVALFNPNPENLPSVNHKDGDKLNNKQTNLEWCTHKHNMKHAFDNGLIIRKPEQYTSMRKPIVDTVNGRIFESITDAAKSLGISRSTLRCYLTGHRKNKTRLSYLNL